MQRNLRFSLLAMLLTALLTGCATVVDEPQPQPQIDVQAFTPTLSLGAYFGTKAVLVSNPEYRPAFVGAAAGLRAMSGDLEVAKAGFLKLIKAFPIENVNDDDKKVIVSGAIDQLKWLVKRLEVVPEGEVREDILAVAAALADGIEDALKKE